MVRKGNKETGIGERGNKTLGLRTKILYGEKGSREVEKRK